MIIGLTGEYGSGKEIVADYFVSKGFQHISLSDFIREECKEDCLDTTRHNMIAEGNKLRKQFGNWVLGKMAKDMISPDKNYVVVSIRNPGEVKELRKLKSFFLVNVIAPLLLRYKRVLERNRDDEYYSSEHEFLKQESRELKNKDRDSQQLQEVYKMANIVLNNRYTDRKKLFNILDKMYSDLKIKTKNVQISKEKSYSKNIYTGWDF